VPWDGNYCGARPIRDAPWRLGITFGKALCLRGRAGREALFPAEVDLLLPGSLLMAMSPELLAPLVFVDLGFSAFL